MSCSLLCRWSALMLVRTAHRAVGLTIRDISVWFWFGGCSCSCGRCVGGRRARLVSWRIESCSA